MEYFLYAKYVQEKPYNLKRKCARKPRIIFINKIRTRKAL